MIYKFTLSIIVVSILFEVFENLFPIKKMNKVVVSFGRILMIYYVCSLIFGLF